MNLASEDKGAVRVVSVLDTRIDAAVAIKFKDELRQFTEDGPERIILDLSNVTFLDSSGLGAVVAAMKLAAPERKLELAGLNAMVQNVFRLTRMDTVFTIHPDVAAATTKLADAG